MNLADQLLDLVSAMSLSAIVCMAMAIVWCKVIDLWDAAMEPPRRPRR